MCLANYFKEQIADLTTITSKIRKLIKPHNKLSQIQWTPELTMEYDRQDEEYPKSTIC